MGDLSGGGEGVLPSDPGMLTCELSGLPPVFIGTELFMFSTILLQIDGCGASRAVAERSRRVVYVRGPDVGLCVCVVGAEKQPGRGIVVPALLWPEGRKPWKWGVERRGTKCLSNTASVKGI